MMQSHWRWLLVAAAASPAAVGLLLVLNYGVNVPVIDQWSPDMAGMFLKAHAGQLSLADLLVQHNEHRIIIPRIIFLVLGLLSGWNTIWEMLFEWAVVCATSFGLLWLCVRTSSPRRLNGVVLVKWFICNLLLFIPQQWENTISGMGLCNVLPIGFIVAGLLVTGSRLRAWTRMMLTMLLAAAAMFSAGNGLLAWPLLGIFVAWAPSWNEFKKRKWMLATWCGAFAVFCALYANGYQKPPAEQAAQAYHAGAGAIFQYLLAFLAGGFSFTTKYDPTDLAITLGGGMLVLLLLAKIHFLWLCWRRESELSAQMLVWLLIGGYAVLSGLVAGLYRAGYGPGQAQSSRYVTFAICLPIALVNLVPLICDDLIRRLPARGWLWRKISPSLGSALLVMYVLSLRTSLHDASVTARNRRNDKAHLLLMKILPNDPHNWENMTFDAARLRETASALDEAGCLQPRMVASGNTFMVEMPRFPAKPGQIEQSGVKDGALLAFGHAYRRGTDQPADAVFLTYDDFVGQPIIFTAAEMSVLFPGQSSAPPELTLSQWGVEIPLDQLPSAPRPLKISAWQLDADTGKAIRLGGQIVDSFSAAR